MKIKYQAPEFEKVELWNMLAIMDTQTNGTGLAEVIISDTDPETHTDEDDLDD